MSKTHFIFILGGFKTFYFSIVKSWRGPGFYFRHKKYKFWTYPCFLELVCTFEKKYSNSCIIGRFRLFMFVWKLADFLWSKDFFIFIRIDVEKCSPYICSPKQKTTVINAISIWHDMDWDCIREVPEFTSGAPFSTFSQGDTYSFDGLSGGHLFFYPSVGGWEFFCKMLF